MLVSFRKSWTTTTEGATFWYICGREALFVKVLTSVWVEGVNCVDEVGLLEAAVN